MNAKEWLTYKGIQLNAKSRDVIEEYASEAMETYAEHKISQLNHPAITRAALRTLIATAMETVADRANWESDFGFTDYKILAEGIVKILLKNGIVEVETRKPKPKGTPKTNKRPVKKPTERLIL